MKSSASEPGLTSLLMPKLYYVISVHVGTTPECPDEQLINPKSLVDFRAARIPVLLLTKTMWFSLIKWFSFRF